MKIPPRLVPLLLILLLLAFFLLGRMSAQIEYLKGGGALKGAPAQTGTQTQGQTPQPTQAAKSNTLTDEQWQRATSTYAGAQGKENAAVTIVEFTDYQCPYCGQYFEETFSQIEKQYIQTGKVRYFLRDLPLPMHANAPAAAEAARCAGDEGKYWQMHDLLFTNQSEWSSEDPENAFVGYARKLGLNTEEFSSCFKDEKYQTQISEDLSFAQEVGIGGTPGFIINGKLVIGAMPFASFKSVIDAALK